MKHLTKTLFLCGIPLITSFGCKEEANPNIPCGCESETLERYENVRGTVYQFDTLYFIQMHLPDNTINIAPCDGLNDEMNKEGLEVILSGELKKPCPNPLGTPNTKVSSPYPFALESIEISNP